MKRLVKSHDKKLCGVCGGIAEYFNIDPSIVRLLWLLTVLFAGKELLSTKESYLEKWYLELIS